MNIGKCLEELFEQGILDGFLVGGEFSDIGHLEQDCAGGVCLYRADVGDSGGN